MATTGTPLNLPLMADSDRTPYAVFNAAMAILNGGSRVDEALANEVAITTVPSPALSATAYGKMHVITGTSADYTIALPTPATADLGKIIGFRVANSATKVFTIDAAGSETIDGALTRTLRKDDVLYLKAVSTTGNTWQVIGEKRYAEGTFTPVIAFGGASVGITYTTQKAWYKRIGNQVFIEIRILLSAKGSSTGVATITGLPYPAATTADLFQLLNINWLANATYTGVPVAYIDPAGPSTILLYGNNNGTVTQLTDAAFSATTNIILSGAYTLS